MKTSDSAGTRIREALQVREDVCLEDFKIACTTLLDRNKVLLDTTRIDSALFQELEPFTTAATKIDHPIIAYRFNIRQVDLESFFDLLTRTTETIFESSVKF